MPAPRWRQWAWFVGLWLAGVLFISAVAGLLRWVLQPG